MTEAAHLLLNREGAVAFLTLNRPGLLNALSPQMAELLDEHCNALAHDRMVRCIVIRGAGGNFSAGGDIGRFATYGALGADERRERVHKMIGHVHSAIEALHAAPQPVLASVEGACAGYGLGLALACDLCVCADDATLSLAYTRIGVSPDGGSTWALPRAVGRQRAMKLALLAERFSAADGAAMGIISHVVASGDVASETAKVAAQVAGSAANALARTKMLINNSFNATLPAQLHAEEQCFADSAAGAEFEEGVKAFLEKRRPVFPALD